MAKTKKVRGPETPDTGVKTQTRAIDRYIPQTHYRIGDRYSPPSSDKYGTIREINELCLENPTPHQHLLTTLGIYCVPFRENPRMLPVTTLGRHNPTEVYPHPWGEDEFRHPKFKVHGSMTGRIR